MDSEEASTQEHTSGWKKGETREETRRAVVEQRSRPAIEWTLVFEIA